MKASKVLILSFRMVLQSFLSMLRTQTTRAWLLVDLLSRSLSRTFRTLFLGHWQDVLIQTVIGSQGHVCLLYGLAPGEVKQKVHSLIELASMKMNMSSCLARLQYLRNNA